MKLGILTFHSQLNYGGVLQCWALKRALERMGHEVVVIDRWLDPDNAELDGPVGHTGLTGWCAIAFGSLFGCGTWRQVLRHVRTRRFVKGLGLTPYHFHDWKDAPKDLGVDCLVVGSDQVWHGDEWLSTRHAPYLLFGAPQVPAIAYAASFGMTELSDGCDYAAGFRRFSAISVREAEGVGLVKGTGYPRDVAHVVDPTLLLPSEAWRERTPRQKVAGRVVCYLLSESLWTALPLLERWARASGRSVDVLCNGWERPFPKSPGEWRYHLLSGTSPLRLRRVRVCTDFGPEEFVRAFAQAEACVTDSFHAVMFSSIYGLDVRFLRPKSAVRQAMFARIAEFARTTVSGPFVVDDLPAALRSIDSGVRTAFDGEAIAHRREASRSWLEAALADVRAPGT